MKAFTFIQGLLFVSTTCLVLIAGSANAGTMYLNNTNGFSSSFGGTNGSGSSFTDHWDIYSGGSYGGKGSLSFDSNSVNFTNLKLTDVDTNQTIYDGGYKSSFSFNMLDGNHHYSFDLGGYGQGGYGGKVCITSPVPEPHTYSMLLVGLGLVAFSSRRRKQPQGTIKL